MMSAKAMLHPLEQAQIEAARTMGCAVIELPGGVALLHPLVTMRSFNCASITDPTALPAFLSAVHRVYCDHDRPPLVAIADHPRAFASEMDAAGWVVHRQRQLFMERIGPPPPQIERIAIELLTPERVDQFVAILADSFGWETSMRAEQQALYHSLLARGAGRHYLAFADHEPVGTATLLPGGAAWGVYKVATLPAFRGHGIGAALVTRAIRDALHDGADRIFLYTEWGSPAESLYERLGFVPVFGRTLYQPREAGDARR